VRLERLAAENLTRACLRRSAQVTADFLTALSGLFNKYAELYQSEANAGGGAPVSAAAAKPAKKAKKVKKIKDPNAPK
jgi:hypothetical protein